LCLPGIKTQLLDACILQLIELEKSTAVD
jgi:hypothetical protein